MFHKGEIFFIAEINEKTKKVNTRVEEPIEVKLPV